MDWFHKLCEDVEYAKAGTNARELLYQAYGRIILAFELELINSTEYLELNRLCIGEGINNPEYFKKRGIGMEWKPCIIRNRATGQSVHVTIFDRELYIHGFWSFDDLVYIYGEDNADLTAAGLDGELHEKETHHEKMSKIMSANSELEGGF